MSQTLRRTSMPSAFSTRSLSAAVPHVTGHRARQLTSLDQNVEQVASEDLGNHLLRAFEIGVEKQTLLKVPRVVGETVRTHVIPSAWSRWTRKASLTT